MCHNVTCDYDEDLKDAVVSWYDEGIHKLVSRYDKCLKGNYVEKQTMVCATIVSVLLLKNILFW